MEKMMIIYIGYKIDNPQLNNAKLPLKIFLFELDNNNHLLNFVSCFKIY